MVLFQLDQHLLATGGDIVALPQVQPPADSVLLDGLAPTSPQLYCTRRLPPARSPLAASPPLEPAHAPTSPCATILVGPPPLAPPARLVAPPRVAARPTPRPTHPLFHPPATMSAGKKRVRFSDTPDVREFEVELKKPKKLDPMEQLEGEWGGSCVCTALQCACNICTFRSCPCA